MEHKTISIDLLDGHKRNYRSHPEGQLKKLTASLERFQQVRSIVVAPSDNGRYTILAGHGVVEAAKLCDISDIKCDIVPESWSQDERNAYLIADNLHSQEAEDDMSALAELLQEQQNAGYALESLGSDDESLRQLLESLGDEYLGNEDEEVEEEDEKRQSLAERFIVPPFSVLDARQGYWQERKKAWIALGIQSELGRGEHSLGFSEATERFDHYRGKGEKAKNTDKKLSMGWTAHAYDEGSEGGIVSQSGTSIFDPVLCELAYCWFSPPNGIILDPFAGGSVRGIVAAKLGRRYVGIDLRAEQITANEEQAKAILDDELSPQWIVGDSRNLSTLCHDIQADLVFTCPPYYDLEVYSDDPLDLSAVNTYEDFLTGYRSILKQAIERLNDNRFVCIVVGDIRDKRGFYRNFVSDTITACQDAGTKLYNEAILVTQVGSLPVRVGKQFTSSRKLGKTHQNVLVFCKGDPAKAVEACGPVVVEIPDEEDELECVEEVAHA